MYLSLDILNISHGIPLISFPILAWAADVLATSKEVNWYFIDQYISYIINQQATTVIETWYLIRNIRDFSLWYNA